MALNTPTSAAPLAVYRIFFGVLMFVSIVRFWALGWIEKLYLEPPFHFSYYGFEWVQPLGYWTYGLFILCGLCAVAITLGWHYRVAMPLFFLSFTYIELMDKTTYLNHYYFISVLSLLMCFLPAGKYFSIDARRHGQPLTATVPRWTIMSLQLLVGIVYFYAGLAKLHADWLLQAMPLKIWLPGRYDLPLIGTLLEQEWVAYAFSWGGAIYDLCIPFALLYRPTRVPAFIMVVAFHILTRILFPIGMFPYIMIVSTLIYFDASLHQRIVDSIRSALRIRPTVSDFSVRTFDFSFRKIPSQFIVLFFTLQLVLPFRHLLYPGKLFWTEQGYRYSWRVMLMEKAGTAQFKIVDGVSGKSFAVDNRDFLTSFQEKQMATQPDFIVEYAHYLRDHFSSQGHQNIEIYVDSYVALNGKRSRPYIDPTVDLTKVTDDFTHKSWILPFE